MNDHATASVEHFRQKSPVHSDRRKKVLLERAVPFAVIERHEAATGSRRTANDMYDDVDPAELLHHRIDDNRAALGGGDIGRPE